MTDRSRTSFFEILGELHLRDLFSLFALYSALVMYGAIYEYFYAGQLTPLFHNIFIAYDYSKEDVYALINFLTPLAILPIGIKLRSPGQLLAGAMAVFVFIPIPIVFASLVPEHEFWRIYALLWIGYFCVCSLSSISVNVLLPATTDAGFRRMLLWLYGFIAVAFVYAMATNHISFVGFAKAHDARSEVTVAGIQGYILAGYIASFGGLLIAMAIMLRKYYLVALALAGFIVCYLTLAERNALLMPAWIAYMFIAQRLFFGTSTTKYVLTVMAPFLMGTLVAEIIGTSDRSLFLYDAFTLANFRLFSVPALGFNIYYNFFETHPLTYWSHINIVGKFIQYPYGDPLSLVMADQYHMGNYNASFLETDGLAAAGTSTLPFISLVFGIVLVFVNTCMRGLNMTLLAILMAGPSIALIDTGLGPGLLTNGLALLALFLTFAAREAPWNLQRLKAARMIH